MLKSSLLSLFIAVSVGPVLACEKDPQNICDSGLKPASPTGYRVEEEGYCLRDGICQGFFEQPTSFGSMSVASISYIQSDLNQNSVAIPAAGNGETVVFRARTDTPSNYGIDTKVKLNDLPLKLHQTERSKNTIQLTKMRQVAFLETGCPLGKNDPRVYLISCFVESNSENKCDLSGESKVFIEIDPKREFQDFKVGYKNTENGDILKERKSLGEKVYVRDSVVFELDSNLVSQHRRVMVDIQGIGYPGEANSSLRFCIMGI